jgi:uncharacterized protein (DUF1778 family)
METPRTARREDWLSIRIEPDVRAVLSAAAAADGRSTSGLAYKIITDWLRRHGLRKS